MVILREIILPVDEQIKLLKRYNQGVITLFEMIYKLIDMLAGPNPDNDKLLKAYDTAVHLADIWTSPINVFMFNRIATYGFGRRFPELTYDLSDIPEQHPDPRINRKFRVTILTPNYEILKMLQKHATVAKD
jgi:hypothetical protein